MENIPSGFFAFSSYAENPMGKFFVSSSINLFENATGEIGCYLIGSKISCALLDKRISC
jgi:hypothetical protein